MAKAIAAMFKEPFGLLTSAKAYLTYMLKPLYYESVYNELELGQNLDIIPDYSGQAIKYPSYPGDPDPDTGVVDVPYFKSDFIITHVFPDFDDRKSMYKHRSQSYGTIDGKAPITIQPFYNMESTYSLPIHSITFYDDDPTIHYIYPNIVDTGYYKVRNNFEHKFIAFYTEQAYKSLAYYQPSQHMLELTPDRERYQLYPKGSTLKGRLLYTSGQKLPNDTISSYLVDTSGMQITDVDVDSEIIGDDFGEGSDRFPQGIVRLKDLSGKIDETVQLISKRLGVTGLWEGENYVMIVAEYILNAWRIIHVTHNCLSSLKEEYP